MLIRYTDLNIESGDVAIIAEQEEINMEVSRKIYDRIGSAPVAPVIAPPERHPDAGKLQNAARLAFRNSFGQMDDANVEISNCSGTLKSLDEDLKNVIRKIDR